MDPKPFAALYAKLERARRLGQSGRWEEAKPLYTELLGAFPRSSLLACELGYAEVAMGEAARAEAHLRRARAIDPSNTEALLGLANIRAARGDLAGAEALYLAVLKGDADDPEANFNLGALYFEHMGRPVKAVPYWERFLSIRPGDPEAQRIRALLRSTHPVGESRP